MKSMSRIPAGNAVFVIDVKGDRSAIEYLATLGIYPESMVTVIQNNPKNGGPVLVEIGTGRLVLDEKYAENILVVDVLADQSLIFKGNKTQQRETILQVIQQERGHFSLEEITKIVQKEDKKIGQITVYRVLRTLLERDILEELEFPDGNRKFEVKKGHHDHIICEKCEDVIEFHNEEIEALQERIAEDHQVKIKSHTMLLIASECPKCR